jgi:exopolyphosphatase/guanosine-5'-triphosphate,3'-diphosphate pyrophosphatase
MTIKRFGPVGIIDIGSNSIRFVAYGGEARVPSTLFNEKVMAALGRSVAATGKMDDKAIAKALEALARFRQLGREMGLKKLHTVATAAVRDAANGPAFLKQVAALGLKPRLLSGGEEAELSGLGVLSAIPRANGIVADLGGGSLELIGVARGGAGEGLTLPLGVLMVDPCTSASIIRERIHQAVGGSRLANAARDHGLYLVGGSFRAIGMIDLKLAEHPLPIVHQHRVRPERIPEIRAELTRHEVDEVKKLTGISAARLANVPVALTILEALIEALGPRRVVVSAFGLREGLLYRDLDPVERAEDPLLAAALEVGERLGRFGDHGAALDQWMNPLFPDESNDLQRLRLAAALLADIAWNAHPDYRSERAVDMAIHGNWVGIDAHGRAILGQALCSTFGGSGMGAKLNALLTEEERERVTNWGRALRLAQRLSGGTESLLIKTSVRLTGGKVVLAIPSRYKALYADQVERRLLSLAKGMGREARLEVF